MDFPVASAIRDALVHTASTDVGYPRWPGIGRSPLPELFAGRMATRFGWQPDEGRLHELADVMQGVVATIHHLTRPGDGIVLHMPAYHPFLAAIDGMGRRVVDVPAERIGDRWTFDHDALDARLSHRAGAAAAAVPPAQPDRARVRDGRADATRRDRRAPRPRRGQRRDPRRARPPAARTRPVRVARTRARRPDGDHLLGVEGVQPRRAALGDPPRRLRRAASRSRRTAVALLRRAQPDGGRGDARGVDRRRRVAASGRRPARRQPSPPGDAAADPPARRRLLRARGDLPRLARLRCARIR